MDQRKLFQVLVIGGALLGVGCEEEASDPPAEHDAGDVADATTPAGDDAGEATADASTHVADAATGDAATAAADAGELMNCGFCPNECCVDDGMGGQKARDGFECCWGTSC